MLFFENTKHNEIIFLTRNTLKNEIRENYFLCLLKFRVFCIFVYFALKIFLEIIFRLFCFFRVFRILKKIALRNEGLFSFPKF
jgi:hypothetical protein